MLGLYIYLKYLLLKCLPFSLEALIASLCFSISIHLIKKKLLEDMAMEFFSEYYWLTLQEMRSETRRGVICHVLYIPSIGVTVIKEVVHDGARLSY